MPHLRIDESKPDCRPHVNFLQAYKGPWPGSVEDTLVSGKQRRHYPRSSKIATASRQPRPGGEGFATGCSRSRSRMGTPVVLPTLHSDSRQPGSSGCRSDTLLVRAARGRQKRLLARSDGQRRVSFLIECIHNINSRLIGRGRPLL